MRQVISNANLVLRGLMELGIVAGLAYWGYRTGVTDLARLWLAAVAPTVVFAFWGLVDFAQLGRIAEPLRLAQELAISALAVLAVYRVGLPWFGAALLGVSIAHHGLVYALDERLLKR